MGCDPTRVCELLVGLGDVEVLGVDDEQNAPLRAHIRRRALRPPCEGCGGALRSDGERAVELVDLPAFGRSVRLVCGTSDGGAALARGAGRARSLSRRGRSRRLGSG